MTHKISFIGFTNDFELLDTLRIRHQMFVGENLLGLSYLLMGYALATPNFDSAPFDGFVEYILKKHNIRVGSKSWIQIIRESVSHPGYEIARFFELLDEFRNTNIIEIAETSLTASQRDREKSLDRRNLVLDRETGFEKIITLEPPYFLRAVKIGRYVHAFYYDISQTKYYEQCLQTEDHLFKWAERVFFIPKSQWVTPK